MFVRCEASILHADLDSFYASVEQRDDPALRGRPVIVGGGVVLAASYEAKAYGVRTAMGGVQARRLCPRAVVVPPRMSAYTRASEAVFAVFRHCTPVVEPLSVDEAFLDVGGLRRLCGTPVEIAARLRADVRDQVGLPITVGVARTKFLAKVASQEAKPDGLLLVPPDQELAFLHPLPVRRLWGVGAVTADKLHAHGIHTVADVAELSESTLASMVGDAMGRQLYALSRNIDRRRVTVGVRRRSVGAQRALGRAGSSMSPPRLTRWWSPWSTGSPAGCAPPDAPAEPWCCACDSTTSAAPPGHTRCRGRLRRRSRSWPPPAAGRGGRAGHRHAGTDPGRLRGLRYRPQRRPAADAAV
ncbi:impB/mucB/samB family protein [Mycobacterium kansasii]|uniref:ImpB/mucB/samB family protein n=1 Tax=Mycobacterium kansasii TaxID=1768 RepID=A0A1V3X8K1_MYCKA|nr:impB/mucB/samB family protein [Mycobacterium kansasii]